MVDQNEMSRGESIAVAVGYSEIQPSRMSRLSTSRVSHWIIGVSLLLLYVSLGLYLMVLQDRPEAYDISGYLMEANRISDRGGVSTFPKMIIEGEWKQANQHPLYILAIAPFAEFDFKFMVSAKFVSLFFGAIAVLIGYIIALRYYDPLIATLGVAGFALTQQYIKWSTLVACESLLILLSILTMTAIFAGFRDRRYWVIAGFLAGIAYLTKVTALLLLPGFFLAVLLHFGQRAFRVREVYLFVAAFIFACSPLLISNVIVHGTPFYNVNIDNLSDKLGGVAYRETSIEQGSMIRVYEEAQEVESGNGGVAIKPGQVIGLATGALARLPGEIALLLETLSPWPLNTAPRMFRWALGIGILALFFTGVIREPNTGARNYILLTVAVFVLALSLHRPIERYLLPIHFYIWVYAAMGFAYLLFRFREKLPIRALDAAAALRLGTAAFCALLAIYIVGTKDVMARAPHSVTVEPHRIDLAQWMRANVGESDRYVEGPNTRWVLKRGKHLYPPSELRSSPDGFLAFIRASDVKYVIAEMKSMHLWRYRGRIDRRQQFEGLLEFDAERGIQELDIPDDWKKVAVDDNGIVEYVVYEVIK